MSAINIEELQSEAVEESSETIRKRVMQALEVQKKRFSGTSYRFNSDILPPDIPKYCVLDEKAQELLPKLFRKLKLSARGYHRLLRVSRTIADLEQSERILDKHIKEAACYRMNSEQFMEG